MKKKMILAPINSKLEGNKEEEDPNQMHVLQVAGLDEALQKTCYSAYVDGSNPQPETLNPKPQTPTPKPQILNPEP